MPAKPYVVALEEHYFDPEVKRHFEGLRSAPCAADLERLDDVGALRLREMDEAGIDLQVLSHANPGLQKLDAETAVRLARGANDRLHETVRAHPDRFAAFAAIPTPDPKAAADELERTVTKLGFKGALVNGLTNGVFLDDKRFWPIFERAAGARRADLHASRDTASGRDRGLLQGLRRAVSLAAARRLGLHGRDRDAGRAHGAERRVRQLSGPQDHHGPYGRGAAVLSLADQHGAGRDGQAGKSFRDIVLRAFLHHDERASFPTRRCCAA